MYIDCKSINSSSSAVKQTGKTSEWNTTINKFIQYLCFIIVVSIHSCRHCLKMSSFSLKKNKFWSINLTCWRSVDTTTALTILKSPEYELLKRFLSKDHRSHFLKFSILSNILDLEWCLLNTKLHSKTVRVCCNQALVGWIYKRHIMSFSTNQIVQFLYSPLEIILNNVYNSSANRYLQDSPNPLVFLFVFF